MQQIPFICMRLSEEETQSKDLKVKQSEIRQLSEKIISLSDNRV